MEANARARLPRNPNIECLLFSKRANQSNDLLWRKAAESKLIADDGALQGSPPQIQPKVQILHHLHDATSSNAAE
jgi:hypothetical protein